MAESIAVQVWQQRRQAMVQVSMYKHSFPRALELHARAEHRRDWCLCLCICMCS